VMVRQALVVQAEQVQDGRLQVVDVDRALDHVEAQLVGRPVSQPRLHAAARQPDRERLRPVLSASWTALLQEPGRLGTPVQAAREDYWGA
jgi:hypothetical protein